MIKYVRGRRKMAKKLKKIKRREQRIKADQNKKLLKQQELHNKKMQLNRITTHNLQVALMGKTRNIMMPDRTVLKLPGKIYPIPEELKNLENL